MAFCCRDDAAGWVSDVKFHLFSSTNRALSPACPHVLGHRSRRAATSNGLGVPGTGRSVGLARYATPSGGPEWFRRRQDQSRLNHRPLADMARIKTPAFRRLLFLALPGVRRTWSEWFVDLNDREVLRRQRQGGGIHGHRGGFDAEDLMAGAKRARHHDCSHRDNKRRCEDQSLQGEHRMLDCWASLQASAPCEFVLAAAKSVHVKIRFSALKSAPG